MTTHILAVTDMSGSMTDLADDVRGGYNSYLEGLAESGEDFTVTTVLFDHEYMPLCVGVVLAEAPRLDSKNYRPRGNTALLDAVGRTVADFELRVPELGDDKVMLVIQTDGRENASREYTHDMVRKLIAERTGASGKWGVLYIGAGADTWSHASAMGVGANNYVNTSGSKAATQGTYGGLAAASVQYSKGASADDATRIVAEATRGL